MLKQRVSRKKFGNLGEYLDFQKFFKILAIFFRALPKTKKTLFSQKFEKKTFLGTFKFLIERLRFSARAPPSKIVFIGT